MSNPRGRFKKRIFFFGDCFFSSEFPSIPKSIYPKAHIDIHSPAFGCPSLIQTDLLPIIFDTGASLSIYPYKIDFVVPITPLPEPITLVCMGYGTANAGIGIVKCRFHTGGITMAIQSQCYHVPNSSAQLMGPRQFFSTCGGSTGTFTIGDMCATLSLDGKPSFQILYDFKSYLPVAFARNATA